MVNVLYIMDKIKRVWGVTSVVRNYISHIDRNMVNIDVVAWEDSDSDLIQEFELMGTHVYFAPKLSLKNILEYNRFWDNFFKENNDYDIVHSHFNQIDYIVFKMAKKHGVKVCISHSHNSKFSENKIKAVRNFLMCYPARKLADYWAACSEVAGIGMYGKGYSNSNKKILVKNAVDCNKFKYNETIRRKLREEYNLNTKKIVGVVGSFKIQKNHEFMIEIANELIKIDNSYHFLFIGEGELRCAIEEKINKLGISKYITLTGAISNVYDFYQMMDVFVMPSLFEGLPVTGMEAQAAGLPCVFSDTITQEVNLNKKAVRYVSLNDSTSKWADTIDNLIEKYPRDGVREIIREAGYDIEYEAENLSKFYIDCVSMKANIEINGNIIHALADGFTCNGSKIIIPKYTVKGVIGKGANGLVLRAKENITDRIVAIKIWFKPNFVKNNKKAINEIKKAAQLSLGNIYVAHIYNVGEVEGFVYCVMEYLEGRSLKNYLKPYYPSIEKRYMITKQIFKGLEQCHADKIFHGDMHLNNILYLDDGNIKIIDFGTSQLSENIFHKSKKRDCNIMKKSITKIFTYPEAYSSINKIIYLNKNSLVYENPVLMRIILHAAVYIFVLLDHSRFGLVNTILYDVAIIITGIPFFDVEYIIKCLFGTCGKNGYSIKYPKEHLYFNRIFTEKLIKYSGQKYDRFKDITWHETQMIYDEYKELLIARATGKFVWDDIIDDELKSLLSSKLYGSC